MICVVHDRSLQGAETEMSNYRGTSLNLKLKRVGALTNRIVKVDHTPRLKNTLGGHPATFLSLLYFLCLSLKSWPFVSKLR
jgi:hypothetical protein